MMLEQVIYSDTGTGGLLRLWYRRSTGTLVQVVYRSIGYRWPSVTLVQVVYNDTGTGTLQ